MQEGILAAARFIIALLYVCSKGGKRKWYELGPRASLRSEV
jgi:hypothetical protein